MREGGTDTQRLLVAFRLGTSLGSVVPRPRARGFQGVRLVGRGAVKDGRGQAWDVGSGYMDTRHQVFAAARVDNAVALRLSLRVRMVVRRVHAGSLDGHDWLIEWFRTTFSLK